MISIRLEGLPAEVNATAWLISQMPEIRVLEESKDYKNRGVTKLVRRYMKVDFAELPDSDQDAN